MKKFNLLFAILFVFVITSCDNKSQSSETTATVENETNQDSVNTDVDSSSTATDSASSSTQSNETSEETTQNSVSSTSKSSTSGNLSSAEMNGEPVELIVKSFKLDPPSPELVVTLINRKDKALRNIRFDVIPVDGSGEKVTSATGRDFVRSISRAQNPFIVDAKSKIDITVTSLANVNRISAAQLRDKLKKLEVELKEYQDSDGTKTKL